ncbi:UDP-N-acetylmuramyl pentapeptide phosphotransferase/UDP-N-acetylglucosamine-1-phosphate transferase [Antarctobacter heliothermus]|uniref:UDP-N-acetylmuramyl pentapeptide phosphotransferase/UDP-N-acetylglucosamine-1-phosphate transferase n=1 Tax=Antarctobacter heliothermus TaxID=74033 RepID=A0A239DCY1_9RHOB|nr:UDP-N-acetylmuramyl pentapeptide phosphotransferase/UDP-N-acetylglucosamine-1-phosphate transferase [Antarctobacter heliothermus]
MVIAGLAFAVALQMLNGDESFAPLLLLSILPVFITGLAEDLGHHVSPRGRFLAAVFSGVAAVALLGVWVPKADIPGIDWAMATPAVAIILTVIFSAGLCHAVNLIDGMNGLAASVITISALGYAAIATLASLPVVASFALLLVAATIGFLFLNWPVARLFLGDAGAYGLGHLLVWLMILLASLSSEVAVPALLLVIFWPLADVLHTILRRVADKVSILRPDRMHLHQKVRRTLDIVWFGYRGRYRSNPLTTIILLPFIIAPVVTGVLLWSNPGAAWIALGGYMLAFSAAHTLTARLARRFRRWTFYTRKSH